MLMTTLILFALAAVFGLILLNKVFKDQETPRAVVYSHGGASIGLILLIIAYINQGDSMLMTSLLVFVAAALGFVMFGRDISQRPIPKWLAVGHALIAVTGFTLLLIAMFG